MKFIGLATLALCFAVAPQATVPTQDSPQPVSSPAQGKKTMSKDFLKSLVGSWEGTCQTWFEPGKLADDSKIKGKIHPPAGRPVHSSRI